MNDNRTHPLLAQVPLTVSPFVSLPTATTLPYTHKTLPSTLPPSSTIASDSSSDGKPKYVVSSSGHAAHPDEIIASCKALQAYIQKAQDDADRELKAWEDAIAARELAEKRRVAPGWLDSDARILEPEKKTAVGGGNLMDVDVSSNDASRLAKTPVAVPNQEGDELDRAFGGMALNKS
ncbi:f5e88383-b227-42ae-9e3e-fd86fe42e99a [Sclerotinia trifoliorum]|uniref:F5e88383-b227-42ae-9e3e-fd86fe42e99a n=1 Tax=Sclerotinia trifoliorum TaxID=28548 RepID=A0A8H2VSJ4_9HELO|nr:f5e88383-b227-42ae-9e3e-fd86fe42e99a [Sclerotinia trifoliorum]